MIKFLKEAFSKDNIIKALSNSTLYSFPFFIYYKYTEDAEDNENL